MKSTIDIRRLLLSLALGMFFVFTGSFAEACNVPVFRYALEHWRPDAYRAVLFHRGSLSPSDQERLATLRENPQKSNVNLSIRTVDLDAAPQASDQELFLHLKNPGLPRLVIQYPPHLQLDQPVWSGPFGDLELKSLLDSPLRQEILKRLTAGQTAVWLMVDSGDSKQDDQAVAILERELKNLQQTLKLPELTESPEDVIQDGPPLRVEFSLVRVRRDDPHEQPLVAMLLGSEADLATLNEPLVFPVFGRSRALLPLVGAGISPENIRGSAKFLAGACSCQVKELNPGFDLLLTADWNDLLSWAKSPAFASGEASSADSGEPELVPIPSGSKSESASVPQAIAAPQPSRQPVAATTPANPPSASAQTGGFNSTLMIVAGVVLIGAVLVGWRWQRSR